MTGYLAYIDDKSVGWCNDFSPEQRPLFPGNTA